MIGEDVAVAMVDEGAVVRVWDASHDNVVAEGRVVSYSMVPQIMVINDDGERTWHAVSLPIERQQIDWVAVDDEVTGPAGDWADEADTVERALSVGGVADNRRLLWLHLVSSHAGWSNPAQSYVELKAEHDHEHDGPATIRNHPRYDRHWDPEKVAKVLAAGGGEDG